VAPAVEIENVSKRFKLYRDKPHSLKERAIRAGRNRPEEFWALRDVGFEVDEGETLGLLGHNGSGKSTLLKCVAGTLRPTTGTIRTRGRLAALLELGAGFHGDLTGRENMYLNGSILGFSKTDMDAVFDEIVEFAELGRFIDMQVKHYSSGMTARLGFSVAIHVDPDVLLVDEVLSVGDEAFQRKCIERIKGFQREGRTIFLVTHAADLVRTMCRRGAVLDHGELIALADPNAAVRAFRDSLVKRGIEVPEEANIPDEVVFTKKVRFERVRLEYPSGREFLYSDEPLKIHIAYEAIRSVEDCVFALHLYDMEGNMLIGTNTEVLGQDTPVVPGRGEITFVLERFPLLDGQYHVNLSVHDQQGEVFDNATPPGPINVQSEGRTIGRVSIPIRIEHATTAAIPAAG
jgi:ABC-2 type transport system ATP-binding protein